MKLRLPATRQPGAQLALWDWVGNVQFTSWAQTRNATGDFVEEATKQLLGGDRMTTDGMADICPDIKLSEREYLETKSVGLGRQGIIYEHIHDRTVRFIRRNRVRLSYVFWIHTLRAKDHTDLFALRREMAASIDRVIVVPFQIVSDYLKSTKLEIMNYRATTRDGKPDVAMPGWRIAPKQLKAWSTGQASMAFPMTVYGMPMGGFPVYRAPFRRPSRSASAQAQ